MYNNNHLECNILTINDNVNNANYSKFIDSINRRDRDNVYISIVKFQALIPMFNSVDPTVAVDHKLPFPVIIEIKEARNVYYNESESNFVVASSIVDTFLKTGLVNNKAFFNYENSQRKWIKLNSSSLHSLKICFKTCTSYIDDANPIKYVDLPNFPFCLQLEFKFE